MDFELLRRSDDPNLELAVSGVHCGADGAQPLRHVRALPSQGGSDRVRFARPDGARLGHLGPPREAGLHRQRGPERPAGRRRRVRHLGRRRQVRAGGPRAGCQLGVLPPHAAVDRLRSRRPVDQALENERLQGLGSRHVARPLQQRLLLSLPPEEGLDPVELRGQDDPRLGRDPEDRHPHLPPRERPLLGLGGAPVFEPGRGRARCGHGRVQAGLREAAGTVARQPLVCGAGSGCPCD
mmetsp:Transcript_46115/g.118482  ORF Transcript_46115/g.118482 Transcript_46115/m.118482 type:complete len:238 (+) Transcript_46115:188-901(+)